MKRPTDLNQELRQRILNLPAVWERTNAGIHEDAFFVGRTMFMHIHGAGHCDIRLSKADQGRVLADGKARPHRWAPEAGYNAPCERSRGLGIGDRSDSNVTPEFCRQAEH